LCAPQCRANGSHPTALIFAGALICMLVPVNPARLVNISPPPLPPWPEQVVLNLPGVVDDANETEPSSEEEKPESKDCFDSKKRSSDDRTESTVRFADDAELVSSIASESEDRFAEDAETSSSGSSESSVVAPVLRKAISTESLGSSGKPDPVELRKVTVIQNYKNAFRAKVKTFRHECTLGVATGLLREVPFFREFDDVLPGTIFHLASTAVLQEGREGEVLFRQGDDPVDCYVVLRGAVGVYIRKTPQESPREFQLDDVIVSEEKEKRTAGNLLRRCVQRCCRPTRREEVWDMELDDSKRQYVTEGNNTYSADSDLGTRVAVLGRGAAFGELGLMERKPRHASIRCESKCTFVVVLKSCFQKMFSESIGADAYRKRLFFIRHVAGFEFENLRSPIKKADRSLGGRARKVKQSQHPVDRFKEEEFKEGHLLLEEAHLHDPIIFIVRSGQLQVTRHTRRRSFSLQQNGYPPMREQKEVPFGMLGPEAIYCSLTTLGLTYPEQFTIKVASQVCSMYVARQKDLAGLPSRVIDPLRKHLRVALRPLLCYSGAYQCLDQLVESDPKPSVEEDPMS